MRLVEIQDAKMMQKIAICEPSHNLSRYIFVTKARIDNRKKIVKQQYPPTCTYNMVNFGLLASEIVSLVWGTHVISTGFASWQHYCTATLRR